MASFWFVSAPLPGHLDWGGFLKTARALQAEGHEVLWVSGAAVSDMVAAAGLPLAEIPDTGWLWPLPPPPDFTSMPPEQAIRLRYQRALDTWLTEELIIPAVEALLALARQRGQPDCVVTDPFLTASALAAEAFDVPLAVCGWPALCPPDEEGLLPVQVSLADDARGRIERLAARFGLRGTNFAQGPTPAIQSELLHISYFSRFWHQSDPEPLPQTHFVGGMPTPPAGEPPEWLRALEGAPLGMVTLGTVFTGDLGFFAWAAQGMARADLVPLVVLGRPLEAEEKRMLQAALPGGTRLLTWVDYDHVFPHLKIIVHHGGMGTTHAAVVHGVPQVVVPHAADQRGQARRVAQARVGLNLSALDVRQGRLGSGIRAVVTDAKVADTARRLAGEFAALGGPPEAARLLIELVERQ